ncbi:Six-hairpin glycosidase-like protein [Mucor mucedo]|uniref:Six-hairpin glycosidase-like protein n=1 Tax=Mucor mucedo TaxID=29922 RepID=UPI00221FC2CE|nr:Six-hairpin glycosidase-like protein [Mucor mucedo]KAI7876811.1 Six-hairpin glycosidase-like protein [Mucor mucedo]
MANYYNTTLKGEATTVGLLKDYVTHSINVQSTSTAYNCLGEPKFNADGFSFTGSWRRPPNDGPAERASSFILIADSILKQSDWEEANGVHFYTLLVMRKGLIHGANFAKRNRDTTRTSTYTNITNTLKTTFGPVPTTNDFPTFNLVSIISV